MIGNAPEQKDPTAKRLVPTLLASTALALFPPNVDAAPREFDRTRTIYVPTEKFVRQGRVKKNVAPLPISPSAQTRPPCRSMMRFTVASPIPLPSKSPGWNR